ncbi:hypothetical protein [Clostridium ihumii]|uniref:hypothetical protein n=1 Tax=Clostridium ihumii TaxID=1470356 RepID=UPI00058C8A2F|nr:hypothetical protein [Clostridium ihumii]
MDKTVKFEIITGINEGYFHNNEVVNGLEMLGVLWQEIAIKEYEESGIYVSAVICSSKTVYSGMWGCPKGGEDTIIIAGTLNKEYTSDIEGFKTSVLRLAKEVKEKLKQESLTCDFTEVELFYLKD